MASRASLKINPYKHVVIIEKYRCVVCGEELETKAEADKHEALGKPEPKFKKGDLVIRKHKGWKDRAFRINDFVDSYQFEKGLHVPEYIPDKNLEGEFEANDLGISLSEDDLKAKLW